MNDADLVERLERIGHETFAEYYRDFCDWTVSNQVLIERLIADESYSSYSGRTKIYRARSGRSQMVVHSD